jgi:chromate transporter
VLAALYGQLSAVPRVAGALRGMGAVAAGLVLATGLKVCRRCARTPLPVCTLCAGADARWPSAWWRWPMVWVVLGLGALSMAFAWWRLRR